jgi:CrcB protein
MWKSVVAVAVGGAIGSLLRWWLGITLNALFPSLPPGTLAVNIIGGYIIGAAIVFFGAMTEVPPEWRLFVITGFCGGLTTFSTFSAEIYAHMTEGRIGWAIAGVAIHVVGAVGMAFLGGATVMWLRH